MAAAATNPDQARQDVTDILSGKQFKPKPGPRPLRGVLQRIGDALAPIGRGLTRAWQAAVHALGAPAVWTILVLAVVATIVGFTLMIRRRGIARAAAPGLAESVDGAPDVSVESLETEATAAEAAGDHARAVRLRFRAGLLRLERDAHAIQIRPGLTTREVRHDLASPRFDGLADTFEAVAYGGETAAPSDTANAREHWPIVVRDAERVGRST